MDAIESTRGTEGEESSRTEGILPESVGIDGLSSRGIVDVMHGVDVQAWEAFDEAALDALAAVVDAVVDALDRGGRLIYVGAGTSGRLGVLDASECPPTFGLAPDRVLGLIAGGERALRESIEGAEDLPGAGARAIEESLVGEHDVICGISASGRTKDQIGVTILGGKAHATPEIEPRVIPKGYSFLPLEFFLDRGDASTVRSGDRVVCKFSKRDGTLATCLKDATVIARSVPLAKDAAGLYVAPHASRPATHRSFTLLVRDEDKKLFWDTYDIDLAKSGAQRYSLHRYPALERK